MQMDLVTTQEFIESYAKQFNEREEDVAREIERNDPVFKKLLICFYLGKMASQN